MGSVAQSRMNVLQIYQDGWGREKEMGGRVEGWKDGRMEGWKGGRRDGWKVVWVEERSTIKDECATD